MAGHEPMRSLRVAVLVIALGEHVFFFGLEHGKSADFLKIAAETAFSRYDTG